MEVTKDFLKNMVSYIEGSSSALEKVAQEQAEYEKDIPAVVDTLIAQGLVDPMHKEAACEALKDKRKALASLKKTAEEVKKSAAAVAAETVKKMGQPVKEASDSSNMRESDRIWREAFGQ